MKIGIGLPAAVPGVDATAIPHWAVEAERAGFSSVGVIDRLVYDNLEPLTVLAAAAAATTRVELLTTVLNVGWRANPVLLGKQLASVDLLSGGRLTAGFGLGGWPEDFEASAVPTAGGGARLDAAVTCMRQVWAGELAGQGGTTTRLAEGRPSLLFGGLVPASFSRAARSGDGWVAPLMGFDLLQRGSDAVHGHWHRSGRGGSPRIVTGRYVALGGDGREVAREYLAHYYGEANADIPLADTPTTHEELRTELDRLTHAGVTDSFCIPAPPTSATSNASPPPLTAHHVSPDREGVNVGGLIATASRGRLQARRDPTYRRVAVRPRHRPGPFGLTRSSTR